MLPFTAASHSAPRSLAAFRAELPDPSQNPKPYTWSLELLLSRSSFDLVPGVSGRGLEKDAVVVGEG